MPHQRLRTTGNEPRPAATSPRQRSLGLARRQPLTLTRRGLALLNWIIAYTQQHNISPSLEEMAAAFSWASLGTASGAIARLERDGWLGRSGSKSRNLIILRTPEQRCPTCGHELAKAVSA